jgi:hypothetical protein
MPFYHANTSATTKLNIIRGVASLEGNNFGEDSLVSG